MKYTKNIQVSFLLKIHTLHQCSCGLIIHCKLAFTFLFHRQTNWNFETYDITENWMLYLKYVFLIHWPLVFILCVTSAVSPGKYVKQAVWFCSYISTVGIFYSKQIFMGQSLLFYYKCLLRKNTSRGFLLTLCGAPTRCRHCAELLPDLLNVKKCETFATLSPVITTIGRCWRLSLSPDISSNTQHHALPKHILKQRTLKHFPKFLPNMQHQPRNVRSYCIHPRHTCLTQSPNKSPSKVLERRTAIKFHLPD